MPTVAIWLNGPADEAARSILNPVSFVLLSVQLRFIWFEDMALAVRLLGADGIGSVVVVVVVVTTVVVVVGCTEVVVEVVGSVEVVLVVESMVVVEGDPICTAR